jgi:hypothetical protein
MEDVIPGQEDPKKEEAAQIPTISEQLSVLTTEQTKDTDIKISELSHSNEGETGFNPTPAELATVYEGIKAQIKARGSER